VHRNFEDFEDPFRVTLVAIVSYLCYILQSYLRSQYLPPFPNRPKSVRVILVSDWMHLADNECICKQQ